MYQTFNNSIIRLSLDCVYPIYEGIGLLLTEKKHFSDIIKSNVRNGMLYHFNEFKMLEEGYLNTIYKELETTIKREDFHNFLNWVNNTYVNTGYNYKQWELWKFIIKTLVHDETTNELNFDLSELKALFNRINDSNDQVTKYILTFNDVQILSEWDKQVFKKFDFDFSDDLKDPFVDIESTLSMYKFQKFWSLGIETLNGTRLENIYIYGKRIIKSLNIEEQVYKIITPDNYVVEVKLPEYRTEMLLSPQDMSKSKEINLTKYT